MIKTIRCIFIMILCILTNSCLFILSDLTMEDCDCGNKINKEKWIATVNTDGSDFKLLCKEKGTCFFVPSLNGDSTETVLLIKPFGISTIDHNGIIDENLASFQYPIDWQNAKISKQSNKVCFSRKNDIYVFDLLTRRTTRVDTSKGKKYHTSFSDNGSKIIYCRDSSIVYKDLEALSNEYKIFDATTDSIKLAYPVFLNDQQIAYSQHSKKHSNETGIYLCEIDGSNRRKLFDTKDNTKFDFNGKNKIAFTIDNRLVILDIRDKSSANHALPNNCIPYFSPDGEQITVSNQIININTGAKLKIRIDSEQHTMITFDTVSGGNSSFDRNGKRIVANMEKQTAVGDWYD